MTPCGYEIEEFAPKIMENTEFGSRTSSSTAKSMELMTTDVMSQIASFSSMRSMGHLSMASVGLRQTVGTAICSRCEFIIDFDSEDGDKGGMKALQALESLILIHHGKVKMLTLKGGVLTGRKKTLTDFSGLLARAGVVFGRHLLALRYADGVLTPALSRKAAGALVKHAPFLRKMNYNVGHLGRECMIDLARGLSLLESITIQNSSADQYSIHAVVNFLPQLRKLDLSFCTKVADTLVRAVARTHPHLQSMNLMGCWRVTDRGLMGLSRFCKQLKTVSLFEMDSISDVGVRVLCNGCPMLEDVDVGACLQLSDEAFESLASLKHLKHLSAFSTSVTASGLQQLCAHACSLETLDLTGCRLLTKDAFAAALPTACFGTSLTELEVAETFCGEDCITEVLMRYHSLTSLKLSGCINLKSSILKVIVDHQSRAKRRGSTSLSELELKYCKHISESELSEALQVVDLSTTPRRYSMHTGFSRSVRL
jgi:hypothetical protein